MDAPTTVGLVIGIGGFITALITAVNQVANTRAQRAKNESDAQIAAANLSKDDYVQIITQQRETIEWMTADRQGLQKELGEAKAAIAKLETDVRDLAQRIQKEHPPA